MARAPKRKPVVIEDGSVVAPAAPGRRRKGRSKISRMPADQRAYIEQLMREDRMTLSEMWAAIRARFPDADVSRTGLHRYQESFAELTARMREIDRAAEALVGELGDGIGDKAGALLANAVTTLATNVALRAQTNDDVSIDEVRKMAIAARNALDTRRLSLRERQELRREAREELQREQAAKLANVVKDGGLSDESAAMFRRKVLGIE